MNCDVGREKRKACLSLSPMRVIPDMFLSLEQRAEQKRVIAARELYRSSAEQMKCMRDIVALSQTTKSSTGRPNVSKHVPSVRRLSSIPLSQVYVDSWALGVTPQPPSDWVSDLPSITTDWSLSDDSIVESFVKMDVHMSDVQNAYFEQAVEGGAPVLDVFSDAAMDMTPAPHRVVKYVEKLIGDYTRRCKPGLSVLTGPVASELKRVVENVCEEAGVVCRCFHPLDAVSLVEFAAVVKTAASSADRSVVLLDGLELLIDEEGLQCVQRIVDASHRTIIGLFSAHMISPELRRIATKIHGIGKTVTSKQRQISLVDQAAEPLGNCYCQIFNDMTRRPGVVGERRYASMLKALAAPVQRNGGCIMHRILKDAESVVNSIRGSADHTWDDT